MPITLGTLAVWWNFLLGFWISWVLGNISMFFKSSNGKGQPFNVGPRPAITFSSSAVRGGTESVTPLICFSISFSIYRSLWCIVREIKGVVNWNCSPLSKQSLTARGITHGGNSVFSEYRSLIYYILLHKPKAFRFISICCWPSRFLGQTPLHHGCVCPNHSFIYADC